MPDWIRAIASKPLAHIPTFVTVIVLAGLVGWGWHNEWTLPPAAHLWHHAQAPEAVADPSIEVLSSVATPVSRGHLPAANHFALLRFRSAAAVRKAGIVTVPAGSRAMGEYVTAFGMVDYEPALYVRLTSRAAGTVFRVYHEIGDKLKKGDILALIDSAEVGHAKADFLHALAQMRVRSTTLEQLRAAGTSGAVSERTIRDAEAALRESRIALFNAQQTLLNLGLPIRLQDVDKIPEDQLVLRLRLLGLPNEVVKELDHETLTANLLPLRAPFDGRVVERDTATGEVIQGQQPKTLFIFADIRHLHVDLDINPEDIQRVQIGQQVSFKPDGTTREVKGRVSHISPQVDEKTRRVRVHAEVPNADETLRPNGYGIGRIVVRAVPRAVVVPAESIQMDGARMLAFVRTSDLDFEARCVEPGLRLGNLVEVAGVQPGEEVVTSGSFALKSELQKERIASEE